jgi:ribosomal protein S18 acetylase RimI-like enzyme
MYLHMMRISKATKNDVPALTLLINSAYRGEASKKGWTTEANLLSGSRRTDDETLTTLLDDSTADILKYETGEGIITGCVYLQQREPGLYLGMLTVSPDGQGRGTGKQLLSAAEDYAREHNCHCIFMNVISVRHELIAWYMKHGYFDTGRRAPFPVDHRYGVPARELEFMIMQKNL